ncbi:MAG: hypothetical protein ACR2LA_01700 [Acidimicrobiales bacterium]
MRKVTTAMVVLLALTGCGGASDSATPGDVPPPTTSAPPPDGSSPVVDAAAERDRTEQEVLDAYLAATEAYDAASNPADPKFPALAETQTGLALEQAVKQLSAYQATGRVGRDPENSISQRRAEVESVTGETAVVRDCTTDDGIVVVAATGEVVNDLVSTFLFEGHMVVEDGRWKLSSLLVDEEWEGVAGCALEYGPSSS